jgi:hypothetical protein
MSTDQPSTDFSKVRAQIGARLREIREGAFDTTQQKFGESIEHMDAANPQGRIAVMEKGKGSAEVIYSVLTHLYKQGININYLFGPEPMYRKQTDGVALYPENVSDYVKEVRLLAAEAREKLDEVLRHSNLMNEHLDETVAASKRPTED